MPQRVTATPAAFDLFERLGRGGHPGGHLHGRPQKKPSAFGLYETSRFLVCW